MVEPVKIKPDVSLKITDNGGAPVVFVSDIAAAGMLNGVINVTFVTANFTPVGTGTQDMTTDLVISSRLRMDMYCATRLHDQLARIIEDANRPAGVAN